MSRSERSLWSKAQAIAGARGGTFSLDIGALPGFAALNQRLNLAGFTESRQFRIRTGSVVVDGVTTVHDFRLATDQGAVSITGTIDARNRYGGEIAIYGGNGLTVTNTAVLRAGATDTVDGLGSGRVTLGITGGALVVQGGQIDVAGGEGGKFTLRARSSSSRERTRSMWRLPAASREHARSCSKALSGSTWLTSRPSPALLVSPSTARGRLSSIWRAKPRAS